MEHYMGLQKHKKKYLFIADAIIELQMFQGCQNWSWISQGVLGSKFIALPGKNRWMGNPLYICVPFYVFIKLKYFKKIENGFRWF